MTTRSYPHLPDQLADFFATRSKLLLELELDAPNLTTVQSLVILSAVEALLTRDARGWLDSGKHKVSGLITMLTCFSQAWL